MKISVMKAFGINEIMSMVWLYNRVYFVLITLIGIFSFEVTFLFNLNDRKSQGTLELFHTKNDLVIYKIYQRLIHTFSMNNEYIC